LLTGAY